MTTITAPNPRDLATWGDRKLTNYIQKGHSTAGAYMRGYEDAAVCTGLALLEMKSRKKHGEWLPWLKANFAGAERTARDYMVVAREWGANRQSAADLDAAEEVSTVAAEILDEVEAAEIDAEWKARRDAMTAEEREEYARQPRPAPDPEREQTPRCPARTGMPEAPYMVVMAASESLSRARGAIADVDADLATQLEQAHKIVKRVVLALHSQTGGIHA